MAVDKLVDSSQLDSDLTSIANAIRTKGGTSAQLAFPAGFIDAIDAIETGGVTDIVQMAVDGQNYTGHVVSSYSFRARPNMFRYVKWSDACLQGMTTNASYANDSANLFYGVTTIKTIAFPAASNIGQEAFRGCTKLTAVDFGASFKSIGNNLFYQCNVLTTIVLRRTSIVTIGSTNVFTGSNVWKSGGTGGTIYIPKVLYDHLGDGTSSDYKAATNWSTVNGYGTITWAKIEGSIYESQYVDGTLIT